MTPTWPSLTEPMTDRTVKALQFWFTLGGTLVAGTLAWANLSAQVQMKADRSEVEALRQTMMRVDDRTADIQTFLCQSNPRQLGCQRAPTRSTR